MQLGGPLGLCLRLRQGDLLVVPPGVPYLLLGDELGTFSLLSSYPQHDRSQLCAEPADTCSGEPSPLEKVNLVSVQPPQLCPRFGSASPWAGGFGRLLLDQSHEASVVADMANVLQPRRRGEERAPQRVARPEAPLRVIGPQRGPGQQGKNADGSWEYPRRNVVYVECSDGASVVELGCGDLRVTTIADVKRWVASHLGQPAAMQQRIHMEDGEVHGAELEDSMTLSLAGIDYEGRLRMYS
mmetsp:Transcript_41061/g.108500  ORF Transcript_41061/g.108500 Transcript_41061/m.108500 type:complete len:241 (+) Transcript_41061:672-1394(+)